MRAAAAASTTHATTGRLRAPSTATRQRRTPFAADADGRRRRAPLPTSAHASSSSSVPAWLDNAAAQSAAAIDVEYAHYELWEEADDDDDDGDERLKSSSSSKRQRRQAVSVPAAVAVVARNGDGTTASAAAKEHQQQQTWRAGLEVLYHAPYIEPLLLDEEEEDDQELNDRRRRRSRRRRWRWVGGVRGQQQQHPTTTLAAARQNVLDSLARRSCVVLHGADHDLRALGLLHLAGRPSITTTIDTAALPPLAHPKSGAPVSLRRLARRFLGRDIQIEGELHDPVEDATATLDLWLDVAWPRALVDRQVVVGVGLGSGGGGAGSGGGGKDNDDPQKQLVEALEATVLREVAQGRKKRRSEL